MTQKTLLYSCAAYSMHGSKMRNYVCCITAFCSMTMSEKLHLYYTVFIAEVHIIQLTIQHISSSCKWDWIFCADSRSSIAFTSISRHSHHLIHSCIKLLSQVLPSQSWILSHCIISENRQNNHTNVWQTSWEAQSHNSLHSIQHSSHNFPAPPFS